MSINLLSLILALSLLCSSLLYSQKIKLTISFICLIPKYPWWFFSPSYSSCALSTNSPVFHFILLLYLLPPAFFLSLSIFFFFQSLLGSPLWFYHLVIITFLPSCLFYSSLFIHLVSLHNLSPPLSTDYKYVCQKNKKVPTSFFSGSHVMRLLMHAHANSQRSTYIVCVYVYVPSALNRWTWIAVKYTATLNSLSPSYRSYIFAWSIYSNFTPVKHEFMIVLFRQRYYRPTA